MTQYSFAPNTGATAGKTVAVVANSSPTSVSGTLDCTAYWAPTVLVTNSGTVTVFVRMSGEPAASITATSADVPLVGGASHVFANPFANGKTGLAVLSSAATAATIYFTPGIMGIF